MATKIFVRLKMSKKLVKNSLLLLYWNILLNYYFKYFILFILFYVYEWIEVLFLHTRFKY